MITTKVTKTSSLFGGAIAKRTAAVRQRTAWNQHQFHNNERALTMATMNNNFFGGRIHDDDKQSETTARNQLRFVSMQQQHSGAGLVSKRYYHTTPSPERAPAIIMGLATVSAFGYAGSSAIKSYKEWQDSQPTQEELEEMKKQEEQEQAKMKTQEAQQKQQEEKEESEKPRTNVFREWFDVGTKYYEGGFEETMTKREAALILGVRESSSPVRVKDAHRKLLILNHPDTGGSTYLAGKLNEAKELLLKGKSQRKK